MNEFFYPAVPNDLSGISLSELFWVRYMMDGRTKYVITSDMFRRWYYLYSVSKNGKCTKTDHKSKDPQELYRYCR